MKYKIAVFYMILIDRNSYAIQEFYNIDETMIKFHQGHEHFPLFVDDKGF